MNYRLDKKSGNKLSILGFGCMRFPRKLGQIDFEKSEKLILDAIEKGVNYFDTAYIYMGSEEVLGKIIEKNNVRSKIFIATKLPFSKCHKEEDIERLFNEQLDNLKTDYIDYYLIHNLCDLNQWQKLCDIGIEKWIEDKKREGKIKNIGFSFHGTKETFPKLIDKLDWDFCQIQYNYLNTNYQAGTAGLKYAHSKGLSVIIMEPLLGGKLATSIPKDVEKIFKDMDKKRSSASFALSWLWNQKEVTVVLSGMNEESQLVDNINTANMSYEDLFDEKDKKAFDDVVNIFNSLYKVNCTGCNYCMPCPHNVNIPACFSGYNMSYVMGRFSGFQQYILSTKMTSKEGNLLASNCKNCGACVKKCPQNIPIPQKLEEVSKRMEPSFLMFFINIFNKIRKS
ncbi:MAG: aldo/keto reductase [Lachnospirales bacterium]